MLRWSPSVVLVTAVSAACSSSRPSDVKQEAPATVEHATTEAELTTVTLTKKAADRLGIQTVAATVQNVAGTRTLGGEVVVPEGRSVIVAAPVAGTLVAAGDARAGSRVARGTAIFRLVPLIPAERDQRIEAERLVKSAEAEEQAVRQRLQRLEQLLKAGAASVKAVEEARAQQAVAVATLDAARDSLTLVAKNPVGAQGEFAIDAPFAGIVQSLKASAGQAVAAGAPIFEIAQVDSLWVRVPVYAGDAKAIDASQPVAVSTLDASSPPRVGRRVMAPLKADPAAASVDLYFALADGGPPLRPGERVTVELPLTAAASGLVVPDSAVVYDIHGTTWIYEDLGQGRFARRRVEVAGQVGSRVLVARGLAAGTRVVAVGAAELFGTEFGAGK